MNQGILSGINRWWQRWRAIFWGIAFLAYATSLAEHIIPFLPGNPEIGVRILFPLIAAWGILGGIAVKSCWDKRNFLDPKPIYTLYAGGNLSWSRMEYPKSLLEAMPIKEVSKEEARRLKEKMEFNPIYLYADQVQLQPDEIGCDGDNRYVEDKGATLMPGGKQPGPSIKKPAVYEALREQGMTKEKAARISNAQAAGKSKKKKS